MLTRCSFSCLAAPGGAPAPAETFIVSSATYLHQIVRRQRLCVSKPRGDHRTELAPIATAARFGKGAFRVPWSSVKHTPPLAIIGDARAA